MKRTYAAGWFLLLALMAGMVLSTQRAAGAEWPDEEKIITVIVPHAAGGGTDAAIRPLVQIMQGKIASRMQIVNIGGAGSAKGTNEFLNMPADGYSVFVSGTHTIGATMQGLTKGYKEMVEVVGLNWDPFIISVLKTRPYKTMAELIEYAKKNPGTVSLGNAGMGGATGVASVALDLAFGKIFNIVPFNGGQNLRADVLGGRCDAGIFSQSEILSNRDAFQNLAILHEKRSSLPDFKDVPTMKECGFADLDVPGGSYRSIAVRKETPEPIQKALAKAFREAYESKEYQAFMVEQGILSTFTELGAANEYFHKLVKNYEPVVKASGLYKE